MQTSVPELMDSRRSRSTTFELYGRGCTQAGHVRGELPAGAAAAERGVRFVQLYHRGWDQHNNLPRDLALQCKDVPTRPRRRSSST